MCALSCNVFGWGQSWPRCKRCFLAYIFLHSNASHRPYQSVTHIKAFSLRSGRSPWIYDVLNLVTSLLFRLGKVLGASMGECVSKLYSIDMFRAVCVDKMRKVPKEKSWLEALSLKTKFRCAHSGYKYIYLWSEATASFRHLPHNLLTLRTLKKCSVNLYNILCWNSLKMTFPR